MIIFLYGADEYRRSQKKLSVIAEFKKKRSNLGLETFDLDTAGWAERFDEFSKSQSLFETARLAIFENAFELDAKKLAEVLQPFESSKSMTILMSEKEKPVKAINFLLEKPTISQKFENLEGADWMAFLNDESKKNGITLSPGAAHFLAGVYQGNSWALATELQKLNSLKKIVDVDGSGKGSSAIIEKSDLEAFDLEVAPNYWALLNGLKSYDMKNRLGTLEVLLASGDAPAKIFNILASQWKEKTAWMAEFDFAIKSGKLDYEEALTDLAIS